MRTERQKVVPQEANLKTGLQEGDLDYLSGKHWAHREIKQLMTNGPSKDRPPASVK